MFEPSKHMEMLNVTVGDFVTWLVHNVPMNAKFIVNGDNLFYTHVEKDASTISVDDNSLEDEYPEDQAEPCVYNISKLN